jgi:hypothetical protein
MRFFTKSMKIDQQSIHAGILVTFAQTIKVAQQAGAPSEAVERMTKLFQFNLEKLRRQRVLDEVTVNYIIHSFDLIFLNSDVLKYEELFSHFESRLNIVRTRSFAEYIESRIGKVSRLTSEDASAFSTELEVAMSNIYSSRTFDANDSYFVMSLSIFLRTVLSDSMKQGRSVKGDMRKYAFEYSGEIIDQWMSL